jgi:hypothetical protein
MYFYSAVLQCDTVEKCRWMHSREREKGTFEWRKDDVD